MLQMEKPQDIHQRISALLDTQNLCVLATHHSGQPYASLVAFCATEDLKHLFFATPKTTRKFENLKADSRVAMLINNSTNQTVDFHRAISVTVIGHASELVGQQRQPILELYLKKHPHLEAFVHSPTSALVKVEATSYYLVEHFQQVMELHLDQ